MLKDFVNWLDGFLENHAPELDLNEEKTTKIKVRLNALFQHAIDPQEDKGRNPQELRQIHSGGTPPPFDPEQRDMC